MFLYNSLSVFDLLPCFVNIIMNKLNKLRNIYVDRTRPTKTHSANSNDFSISLPNNATVISQRVNKRRNESRTGHIPISIDRENSSVIDFFSKIQASMKNCAKNNESDEYQSRAGARKSSNDFSLRVLFIDLFWGYVEWVWNFRGKSFIPIRQFWISYGWTSFYYYYFLIFKINFLILINYYIATLFEIKIMVSIFSNSFNQ